MSLKNRRVDTHFRGEIAPSKPDKSHFSKTVALWKAQIGQFQRRFTAQWNGKTD